MTSSDIIFSTQERQRRNGDSVLCCLHCGILSLSKYFSQNEGMHKHHDLPESLAYRALVNLNLCLTNMSGKFCGVFQNEVWQIWRRF